MANKKNQDVYPEPEWNFPNVKIGLTYKDSKADFPPVKKAPKNAPNVLLILLDDVGYGWPNLFGGAVNMPTAKKLADRGLKYCQFHSTALCSPTRAALLTGRNHHKVSSGVIGELATGFPGYCGIIPKSCSTIAEILHQNGYATGWWGKNHNVPDNQTSQAGPYDNWPTHQGFDYFYGFIGGETDQFYPALYRGTNPINPPTTPKENYHLTRDLADDCIAWMQQQKSIAPDRPIFCYFSPGATHAPHQPPPDWRGRNKGKFDMGWDKYREQVLEKQLSLGVVPKGTNLTKRPKEIPAWNEYSKAEQKLFSLQAENYADFLEHTDYEIGRIVTTLKTLKELDNTLVIYIIGDNGTSAEGTLYGTINEMASLNGFQPSMKETMQRKKDWGLPGTSPHFAVGWAWAGDAPFQWTKQIASHFGGTRQGTVISWPKKIKPMGEKRFQFHHVIDIAPTILDVVGIKEPSMVNGYPQQKMDGTSMAYTFSNKGKKSKSHRIVQYFEMFGNRALYYDGWIACCRHGRLPWENVGSVDFESDIWELYHVAEDFSESNNLATKYPKKLRELQDMFIAESAKYNVLPLDDRVIERADVLLRPSYFYGRKSVTFYPGMTRLPEGSAPKLHNVTHIISSIIEVPKKGAEGVIVCLGGDTAGWSLYVKNNQLIYHYNWFDMARYEIKSRSKLPKGKLNIRCEFINKSKTPGGPATVKLYVNHKKVGEGKIEKQVRGRFSVESLDIGMDTLSPVSPAYRDKSPFEFTGKIEYVRFDFKSDSANLTVREKKALKKAMD